MWDLIISVPYHCLSFYFVIRFLDSIMHIVAIPKFSRLV